MVLKFISEVLSYSVFNILPVNCSDIPNALIDGGRRKKCFRTERLYFNVLRFENVNVVNYSKILLESDRKGVFNDMFLQFETKMDAIEYLNRQGNKRDNKQGTSYALKRKQDDSIVGEIAYNIVGADKATVGGWIRKRFWGQGYCRESTNKIISCLLDEGYSEIEIATSVENERAYNVFSSIVKNNNGEYIGVDEDYDRIPSSTPSHVFLIKK